MLGSQPAGYLDENNSFQVANADGVRVQVTQGRVNIEAGHVHTIKINVGEAQQVTGDISDDGTYIVSGTRTEPVTITGGNPTIYLENAERMQTSALTAAMPSTSRAAAPLSM